MSLSVHIRKKLNNGGMLDVSFDSEDGILAFLGETGSGKTTVLRCIAGLENPDEGRIVLDGRTLYDSLKGIRVPARKRGIGILGGGRILHSRKTVEQNLHLSLNRRSKRLGRFGRFAETIWDAADRSSDSGRFRRVRVSSRDRKLLVTERTSALLKAYDLDGIGGCYPGELTRQQRLMAELACVMASEPRLLLIDEPFTDLDPFLRAQTLRRIRDCIVPEEGVLAGRSAASERIHPEAMHTEGSGVPAAPHQAVFASADRDEVYAMSSRVLVLEHGNSQPAKEKGDFFAAPVTVSGALLSGCSNVTAAIRIDERHAYAPAWGALFLFLSQKAGDAQQAGTPDTGTKTAAERLPDGLQCVGIRETQFLRRIPEGAREEEYYRFTVHQKRVEDTLTDWRVWFRNGGRTTEDLLWQVPKSEISREEIDEVRRLFIPVEHIMRLI